MLITHVKHNNWFILIIIQLLFITATIADAQRYSIYENHQFLMFEKQLYQPNTNFHTSDKQYLVNQINKVTNYDSIIYDGLRIPAGQLNFWKRIFHDDLLKWNKPDENIRIVINPLFNFEPGKERVEGKSTFINTRGLFVEGDIGKNFSFYADIHENQGSFPNYVEAFIQEREVVPGQGKAKTIATTTAHDYTQATGYISFNTGRYFNFKMGHGKNFIGDGYRSLLLSDAAFSYPYLKFTTDFWKVKYNIMWASLSHFNQNNPNDERFPTKYGVFHYLDWNVGQRFSFGLFESVIWAAQDTAGNYRGFDWHYANPFVFFRPVEYSIGSPDNVNLGFTAKYIAAKWLTFYGQLALDEFKYDELTSGNNWWANKYAYQVGIKTFDLFGIKNLRWQTEYNQARPYLYSYGEPINNYGHYNQELAHPLGANFKELTTVFNYKYHRWMFRFEAMKATYGKDYDDGISYGKDIFKSSTDRPYDYNITTGQGLSTDLFLTDTSLSFLINPRNNFNIAAGLRHRKETNSLENSSTNYAWFAIRTSLKNLYYDF